MRWSEGGWFRTEETYMYFWLIHVVVWQKPTQYCKAIILQFKKMVRDLLGGPVVEIPCFHCGEHRLNPWLEN